VVALRGGSEAILAAGAVTGSLGGGAAVGAGAPSTAGSFLDSSDITI
jgi:hypothetical protein